MKLYFKKIWKKLWEPEDSHGFGQLFLIIGAILLTKVADYFLAKLPLNLNNRIYLGLGIIFTFYGARLIWVSNKSRSYNPIVNNSEQISSQNLIITRKNKSWKDALDLKIKHLEHISIFSKKFFFILLTFLGASFIGLIYNIKAIISLTFGEWAIFLFVSIILLLLAIWLVNKFTKEYIGDINRYCHQIFEEIKTGKLTNKQFIEIQDKL